MRGKINTSQNTDRHDKIFIIVDKRPIGVQEGPLLLKIYKHIPKIFWFKMSGVDEGLQLPSCELTNPLILEKIFSQLCPADIKAVAQVSR